MTFGDVIKNIPDNIDYVKITMGELFKTSTRYKTKKFSKSYKIVIFILFYEL